MAIINKANLKSFYMDAGREVEVNNDSNEFIVHNVNKDITIQHKSDKTVAKPGDEVAFTVVITNNTDIDLNNIHFFNTLGLGALFKPNSVKINNVTYTDFDAEAGFDINESVDKNGGLLNISFSVIVDEEPEAESINSSVTIQLQINNKQYELNSNEVEIRVVDNKIEIIKEANVKVVKPGDEIEYTITITNKGAIENTKLFFKDVLSVDVRFITGSVSIDGVIDQTKEPVTGFDLGNLAVNQSKTIKFKVEVL